MNTIKFGDKSNLSENNENKHNFLNQKTQRNEEKEKLDINLETIKRNITVNILFKLLKIKNL